MANKEVVPAFVEAIGPKSSAVVSLGKLGRVEVMAETTMPDTARGAARPGCTPVGN